MRAFGGFPLKVGIIGCGFIGSTLARTAGDLDDVEAVLLLDTTPGKAQQLASSTEGGRAVASLDEMLEDADLVVEAANQAVVRDDAPRVVAAGRNLIIMSVGALVDDGLWAALQRTAKEKGCSVFIPTGALGGIDLLRSASMANVSKVQLVTTKPPKGLLGVPYIAGKGIDLMALREPLVVFEGTAREAVEHFPRNINVAATIALAGVGFDETRVKIIADPGMTRNYHELIVEGRFGKMRASVLNAPSSSNPKTSYLAALSAIATLKNVVGRTWVGV